MLLLASSLAKKSKESLADFAPAKAYAACGPVFEGWRSLHSRQSTAPLAIFERHAILPSSRKERIAMDRPLFSSVLIVGAGSGLSASLARLFARNGMKVALAARNAAKLKPLQDETGAAAFT